jgi:hypothetical protein
MAWNFLEEHINSYPSVSLLYIPFDDFHLVVCFSTWINGTVNTVVLTVPLIQVVIYSIGTIPLMSAYKAGLIFVISSYSAYSAI